MVTTTLPRVEQRPLSDTDLGPALAPSPVIMASRRKEGRIMLAAGLLLAVYSVVYLFVLSAKFQA